MQLVQIAVTAIGPDRPNVLAAVTGVLAAHEGEITDARASVLAGHVSFAFVLDIPAGADVESLRTDLAAVAEDLQLVALRADPLPSGASPTSPEVTHVVTATGVDHPGVLHAVTHQLARHGVRVCDLQASRIPDGDGPALTAVMLEVALPPEVDEVDVIGALRAVGGERELEVDLRALDDA